MSLIRNTGEVSSRSIGKVSAIAAAISAGRSPTAEPSTGERRRRHCLADWHCLASRHAVSRSPELSRSGMLACQARIDVPTSAASGGRRNA